MNKAIKQIAYQLNQFHRDSLDAPIKDVGPYIKPILKDFYELMEGVIGEEKPRPYGQTSEYGDAQNDLRIGQRQALDKLFGEKK